MDHYAADAAAVVEHLRPIHQRRQSDDIADARDAERRRSNRKLLNNGMLKVYSKFPHGMYATNADVVNGHAVLRSLRIERADRSVAGR